MSIANDLVPAGAKSLFSRRNKNNLFSDYDTLMKRFFDQFDRGMPSFTREFDDGFDFKPQAEVEETDNEIRLTVELAGLGDKDVAIELNGDLLTIKGEKKEEKTTKHGNQRYSERRFGSFERSMTVPAGTDKDKIAATFDKGLLRVTIPKTAEAKEAVRKIAIKS